MKPRALLIGGTGFVGAHLANQLSDRYSIVATGRDHDIRDPIKIGELVMRSSPAIVVNLAAITTVRESFERPQETFEINFLGLLTVFSTLKSNGFTGRVLQVSSSEVYGFPTSEELPVTESNPIQPMSPYAVAKAAAELLCFQWSQTAGFDIAIARPFTHTGPGQSNRFAAAKFAYQIAEIMIGRREPLIAAGSLNAGRDLTDVRDIVRGYDVILHRGQPGKTYNVCSGHETNMRYVLDELIRQSGRAIQVTVDQDLVRASEQRRMCGSYAALNAATGWVPEIPLTRTLADMLAFALKEAGKGSAEGRS